MHKRPFLSITKAHTYVKKLSCSIDSLNSMDFVTTTAALWGQMINYKIITDNTQAKALF